MARPEKKIDWDKIEQRIEAGNTARQIATAFRMNIDTFYDRFKKEYGRGFSDCSEEFIECGKSNIEHTQYLKALSGNVQMLMWLGQIKCGQKIPESTKTDSPIQDQIEIRHKLMLAEAELAELKENNAHKSKTE